ncbi:MAG TPA: ATP-binding protein [Acidimicrobiales bacterium]|jgi:HAMP domain-containing protein
MSTAGWRVPINVKLLAILAVPVLGYVMIASTAVLQARQDADQIRDQASLVNTAVGPISLTTSLIDERTITSLERAGLQNDLKLRIGTSSEARRATDEQLSSLQSLLADNGGAREAYAPAVDLVAGGLDSLRADIDSGNGDDATFFSRYDDYINSLMDANASAVNRVEDAEFWQGAMLSELATRQKNARAVLINALIPVSLNESADIQPEQTVALGSALGTYENRDAAIKELANGPYARAGSVLIEALDAADLAELARNTLDTGVLAPERLFDVASYKGGFVYDVPSGDYIHDNFRASVVEILDNNASDRTAAASAGMRRYLLAGTIGLVVTAGIAWWVSRSITRPLRSLTQQAMEAAQRRLPETVHEILDVPLGEDVTWPELETISVSTNDEVADVADALNTMQQSALGLAAEEAVLRRLITDSLVTLGQRNQNLLSRQLDFITDLERDEVDPDTLADLFYLDHLAIRMRRNAESLLVLAGFDPPRSWVGPTALADIIRAALGEAEEYKRVRVHDIEPAIVAGSATAELAHLLAELIENALMFSPRSANVEVNGRYHPVDDGSGEGYTVTVVDSGRGMSPEEIEQANRRLAGVESYTIAPSKYMGHYVTGKLAARHGLGVWLRSNAPGTGITATIDIPPHLLASKASQDTVTQLPPLPNYGPPTEPSPMVVGDEAGSTDIHLVPPPPDLPEVPDLPEESEPQPESPMPEEPSPIFSAPLLNSAGGSTGQTAGSAPRKPRKRRKRPIAASKLPVPPSPNSPLKRPKKGQAS